MKYNPHNHHTQTTPIRDSLVSHTYSASQTSQEDQDASISKKFKEFLIENSPSYRRTLRPQTMDQNTRMAMTNSMKKSSMYRKLLNSSSARCTMTEQMARYRQRFESAARKGIKDVSSVVFRQFWQQQQKRKFTESRECNFETVGLRVQGRNKSCKTKQSEKISFQNFIQAQKRGNNKKVNSQNYNLISISAVSEKIEGELKIAGNHKQLKNKEKGQLFKRLGLRKNKTQKLVKQIAVNPQKMSEQFFQERRQQKQLKTSQRKEEGKGGIYGTCHFKNLYSPYNGIQIKYISIDNPPIELHPSSKRLVPKPSCPPRPFFKRKTNEIKDNSIVFKQKGKSKVSDPHQVEGWKVQHDQHEDLSDLCHNS